MRVPAGTPAGDAVGGIGHVCAKQRPQLRAEGLGDVCARGRAELVLHPARVACWRPTDHEVTGTSAMQPAADVRAWQACRAADANLDCQRCRGSEWGRPLPSAEVGYPVPQAGGQLSGVELVGPIGASRPTAGPRHKCLSACSAAIDGTCPRGRHCRFPPVSSHSPPARTSPIAQQTLAPSGPS